MELKISIRFEDLLAVIRQLPADQLNRLKGELAGLEQQQPAPERPPISDLEAGYKAMAEDQEREAEAFEWIEGTLN